MTVQILAALLVLKVKAVSPLDVVAVSVIGDAPNTTGLGGAKVTVCATGLMAGEMLARLEARLMNEPDLELRNAVAEQLKITHLRLDKLLEVSP